MIIVAALYEFTKVSSPIAIKDMLLPFMKENFIRGTLILGEEGINGTVAGTRQSIDALKEKLLEFGFNNMEYKESFAQEGQVLFNNTKVKIKKEICTMGVDTLTLTKRGVYLSPSEWHHFIKNPDVIILDTRNDYEYNIGTFKGAINPNIKSFRNFPSYLEAHREEWKDKAIAMFCTGGIRCEKSTAFAKEVNIGREVYHLKGGILKYLEEIPEGESLWDGQCYVFDHRVSVGHNLVPGEYLLCYACGAVVSKEDKENPHYELGVSCPECFTQTTESQKHSYRERMRQIYKKDPHTERFYTYR